MTGTPEELVDHLFRHQSGRMVAVLTRIVGPANISLAEDIVQDVLCDALETWKFGRLPENPAAWLMQAARHRAIDLVRRAGRFSALSGELRRHLESQQQLITAIDNLFGESAIDDGVLALAFACCHPDLQPDSQVTIILKYLCGFSVREIAHAFLVSEQTIEKRLTRGRAALKSQIALDLDLGHGLETARLGSVLRAIYLLFNEGYHGANESFPIREELCSEALRLGLLLATRPPFDGPETKALVALLFLHGARLPGRVDEEQYLVTLAEQDRSRWDRDLIQRGLFWLGESAAGDSVSEYHIEAAIAAHHVVAPSVEGTDWGEIRTLYAALAQLRPSPVIALNHAIAAGMADGPSAGLAALNSIGGKERLQAYPFFHAALAEFQGRLGDLSAARRSLDRAIAAARNPRERVLLQDRRLALGENS
ncbi:MAG: sigma-70 family RNA polymerase sigma factor [Deltaproteobacteria bacterium]|nr:sigma-70 family RNA polymerase sigma factor [Deltaproteobacteria bacterium]